jgi:hypothetical protein
MRRPRLLSRPRNFHVNRRKYEKKKRSEPLILHKLRWSDVHVESDIGRYN